MTRRIVHVGKAKIDNLDIPRLGNEDVLEAKMTVYDVVLMAVFERASDLPRELPCYAFSQAAVVDDVVQHLTAVDVFKNHVIVVLVDDHLSHAADVGVMEKHG